MIAPLNHFRTSQTKSPLHTSPLHTSQVQNPKDPEPLAQSDEFQNPTGQISVALTEAQSKLAYGARVWIETGRKYHEAVLADWRDAGHTVRVDRESPSQILLFFPRVRLPTGRLLHVPWLSHVSTRCMAVHVPHRFTLSVQRSFKGVSH
jgi:hypothetical protein